jgi:hypothetical protein
MKLNNDLPFEAKLSRAQLAHALTDVGFPTTHKTLATKASRGGGPPFQKWGARVIYTWGPSLQWAMDLLSEPVGSTSEAPKSSVGGAGTAGRIGA